VLEIAIIENVQRADLNPVEEALGYRQLQEKFGHTQEQLSTALGKSALEQDLQAALGMKVSIDHAPGGEKGKLLISYKDFEQLDLLCRKLSQTETG